MKKLTRLGWICSIITVAISISMLLLDYMDLLSQWGFRVDKLNLELWSIYAVILGGLIGGALTLIGVIVTINENRKEQNEEATRLVMPMLKLFPAEYDYKWNYIQFDANLTEESRKRHRKDIADTAHITFEIRNVGSRELLELHLCNISATFFDDGGYHHSLIPIIYSGDGCCLNFYFYEKGVYDYDCASEKHDTLGSSIDFDCYYKDCLGNWYTQKMGITVMHSIAKNTPADQRALDISIERMMIKSSPERVAESTLPWACEPNRVCQH